MAHRIPPAAEGGNAIAFGLPDPDSDVPGSAQARRRLITTRAVRGVATLTARSVTLRVLALGGTVVLARVFSPGQFGLVALGLGLVTVANFLADAGLGSGLIRRSEPPSTAELRALMGFQLATALSLCGAVAASSAFFGSDALVCAAIMLASPILAFRTPGEVMLERRLQFSLLAAADIAETVCYLAVVITAALAGLGVWSVALASVVRAVVSSTIVVLRGPVGAILPTASWGRLKPALSFGFGFQLSDGLYLVRDVSLTFALAVIGSLATVGYWSLAQKVVLPLYLLAQAVSQVSFPAMARWVEAEKDSDPSVVMRATEVAVIPFGLCLSMLIPAAPAAIPLLFGHRWDNALLLIPSLAVALAIAGPLSIGAIDYLFARGQVRRVVTVVLISCCVTLALALGGLAAGGLVVLGLGWLAGTVFEGFLLVRALRRIGAAQTIRGFAIPFATSLCAAGVGSVVTILLDRSPLSLVLGPLAGAGTFVLLSLRFHSQPIRQLRRMVDRARRKAV